MTELPNEYEFALCLTHDVDRPYKTFQAPYYALRERDSSHLRSLFGDDQPYWNYPEIMELEDDLGVRSSFYFLQEKRLFREKQPLEWISPENWKLFMGRYDLQADEISKLVRSLDRGGWEVGLHGSYETQDDVERLRYEKGILEDVLGDQVVGGRQHYLRMDGHRTWYHYRSLGLQYDASLGSNTSYGFHGRYDVLRPFDDEFIVFPLTVMEIPLMRLTKSADHAVSELERLFEKAAENDAIMTALWHPRYMNSDDYPEYVEVYRRMIETAKERGAWVGTCEECYENLVNEGL
jgi:peptidoglycan/xylan/chitin deacetylase (PgdA/CDA1 family)